MLNHQKGPKLNLKKQNSCSQFQAPVHKPMTSFGANAPTRLLGPPSNWPYDESFALAMRAAAAVRGMTWNDGVISYDVQQFGGLRPLHSADLHLFFSGEHPFRWASSRSFSTAELRHSWSPHVRAHGLGGDVRRATGGTWAPKSGTWYLGTEYAQLSSLSSWRSRRKECWYHDILVQYSSKTSLFHACTRWSKPKTWPKQRPFKESSKSCGSQWSSGIRFEHIFPKTIKSGSVSNYELHTDSHPPKGQVGHLWILSEIHLDPEKMVDLRATMHWVGLILWCLLTLILGHVKLSSIKLYIYTTWLICLLSKKCHGLENPLKKRKIFPKLAKSRQFKKNSLEWLTWRLLILQ